MEMVLKLNGGRDWMALYGMFQREGEWQYSTSSNNPFNSKIDDDAVAALKEIWPLKVSNKISVPIIEIHKWAGAPRAWKIDLEVKSSAFVNVNDARYATYVMVETGTGELFQAGGGSIDQSKYKTTHWYDPVAGIIVKSERVAIKATSRDEADGKRTKQSLEFVIYPEGSTTHALKSLEAAPQHVGGSTRFRRVGRNQVFQGNGFPTLSKRVSKRHVRAARGNKMQSLIGRQTNPTSASEPIADIQ